jgi:hypothetical protein
MIEELYLRRTIEEGFLASIARRKSLLQTSQTHEVSFDTSHNRDKSMIEVKVKVCMR